LAVRLSVQAKAPRRRICVSRTTLGPDSADGLAYNSRSNGLGNIRLGSCTLDEGVEFLIGESRQRAVDFLETGPCAEEDGQDLLRERLPVVLWQGPDLFGKGPDS
jgi:hypothetical protein